MSSHQVTWYAVDDWQAIYVDGKLVGEQTHSLSPWTWEEVLKALDVEFINQRYTESADAYIEELGRFPEEL